MHAFEVLVEQLLRQEGYWTSGGYKVTLSKADKLKIECRTSPRREFDIIAYRACNNELLAIECKSFLDSEGVVFRNGHFEPAKTYKIFENKGLRDVVCSNLVSQLVSSGACLPKPRVRLCLAIGHTSTRTDRIDLANHFAVNDWLLFDENWIIQKLRSASDSGYDNTVASMVCKLLLRSVWPK